MADAGFDRHAFFNLFEDWQTKSGEIEFADKLGLLTKNFVPKPAYNAFRILNMVQGKRLKTTSDDFILATFAAKDENTFYLLLSNFIPPRKMSITSAKRLIKMTGYTKKELKKFGLTAKSFNVDNYPPKPNLSALPNEVRDIFETTHTLIRNSQLRQTQLIKVKFTIKNIPFKRKVKFTQYLIDSKHANSYALRTRVNKFIKSAKSAAEEKTRQEFPDFFSRYKFDDFEKFKKDKIERRRMLKKLSTADKEKIKRIRNAYRKHLHAEISQINRMLEIKVKKTVENTLQIDGTYTGTLTLKPYSVTLLKFSKVNK
jgi:hypothetical protein